MSKKKVNDGSQVTKKLEPSSWQKEESYQELLDSLRDTYLAFKETAGRRKMELRPRKGPGAGAKLLGQLPNDQNDEQEFKEFYLQPQVENVPQLDEPEKQKKWRSEFLNDVCSRPDPEPLTLLADYLQLEQLQQIEDRSKPSCTRKDLANFYRRHSVYLQHKKYKMLGRWADQSVSSMIIDMQANYFDLMVGRIQMEYDSAYNRTERLQIDDAYDIAVNQNEKRPQPISSDKNELGQEETTLLYNEKPEKSINSIIRLDDVEVYLRIQTYREKLFRQAQKLANGIKWLPYSRRWGIWKQSRLNLGKYKNVYNDQRNKKLMKIRQFSQDRLIQIGVQEDRLLDQICKKFTQHLKLEEYSRQDNKLLSSYKCNHEKPPFLFLSNVEFKEQLVPLAKESKLAIGEFQEIDGGRQASYQVDTLFPAEFQKQALAIQFDWLDTGLGTQADTDILIIQKLTQELQIDKMEMLEQMAKQAETERKKSILGQISKDVQNTESSGKKQRKKGVQQGIDEAEGVARANLVRRVKDMRFFSLDPTQCKLKQADWLNYVCWQPNISEIIKRQNHYLSSPEENPIDSLLLSAFEFLDVNESGAAIKILEDSATAHVRKVKGYYTEISQSTNKPQNDKFQTVEKILNNATFGQASIKDVSGMSQENNNFNQTNIEEYLQIIDPLKFDLVKSYYMLRLLKSRSIKAKLLHTLNYFRAVQKRLAFDIREFFTREKALGGQQIEDALIGPQFGKDEKGNLRAKTGGSSGPGGLNSTRIQRQLDEGSYETNLPDGSTLYDPVSLKGYKYNKRFNPQLTSTCPCVPKFHSTFGRPTLYQDISKEIENKFLEPGRWRAKANPIPSTKDRLIFKKGDKKLIDSEIYILDEHGIQIMYAESLNDMLMLEEELIKIGSYYLNKAEVSQFECSSEPPSTMMDRGEITIQLLEHELEFQLIKVQLIEILLEAYNHICDPLESVRLVQIISDIMAIRPKINLEATYFIDCYDSEKQALQERVDLYNSFMIFQKRFEEKENLEIKKFQELKMRKLFDFIQGKWQYKKNVINQERIGAKEEQQMNQNIDLDINGRKAKALLEIQRQQDLKEIAERHITEFAGDQHTDFAQVLGLPQVTAADLFKRQGQLDPLLIDATREHCNFSKQIEGYPWFFVGKNIHVNSIGLQLENQAPTDFYESLTCITRVHAACEQALEEIKNIHNPENGLAASCLERALFKEANKLLGSINMQYQESKHMITKSKNQMEQDFYLSSSDKLIFLMREFKANLSPEVIQTLASPILVSKLDVQEVAKFDFPRLKLQDAEGFDQLSDEQLTERMIDLAKTSIVRKKLGFNSPDLNLEDELAKSNDSNDEHKIQSPSLLILSCNIIEIHRLRSLLIQLIYETDILSNVYTYQLKKTDRPSEKIVGAPSTTFDTRQITRENANYVDYNDGTKLEIDLPFCEFDPSLKASLDFQSDSCIKALMTNLGVEELRAVVRYQLMQKQILAVSIMRNQSLMDGPQLGLKELKMLGRRFDPFCIPGSMLNMKELFMGALDGPSSTLCKREQQRMSSNLSKEIAPFIMSISAIKTRHKASVSRKWSSFYQKIVNSDKQIEIQLRILRSYRLRLLHEYCQDIMKEVYLESLPIQTVLVCRELRRKAQLFPKDANLFKINQGAIIEHLPYELCNKKQDQFSFEQSDQSYKLQDLIQGKPKSLLFVPSTSEIMEQARQAVQEGHVATGFSYPSQIDEEYVDQQLKILSKGPVFLSQQELLVQNEGRLVNFKQAYSYPAPQTQVLQLFSYLLQIVSLEYYMGRNNAPGPLILALEDYVLSGRNFWINNVSNQDADVENSKKIHQEASQRVINKIMNTKRCRIDLAEDLEQISRRLIQIDDFLKTNNTDQLKLSYIIDLMKMQHQASFYQMLNGIENSIDLYLEHKSQNNFEKVLDVQAIVVRRDHGINLLGNGHYFNNGNRESLHIDPSSQCLQDHYEFMKGYQSVIDEAALVPLQPTIVRRLFGRSAKKIFQARPAILSLQIPSYSYLKSSFLNMDDEQRSFLATNFFQLDEGLHQYLVFLGLAIEKSYGNKDDQKNAQQNLVIRPKDVLQAKIEYLGLKVEQKQLQRVLMSWTVQSQLPSDVDGYLKAIDLYREQTMLKTLLQRDELIHKYYESNQKDMGEMQGGGQKKSKSIKQSILENINTGSREHQMITKISQVKAEIQVTMRTLDIEMIKMSRSMIEREHEALLATFEQAAAHDRVLAFIHPQQQFASTLYQSVDRNSHLDVVNKLGFVQVFLTKLRNRCTEVETLASGPGIVFSLKDFNECLQNFCQGALKYSEAELRTRVETQYIRQNQYQHLIYMKEKQAYYYRRKCEQFLENIDKIVNSKISQKGSQLIYELDVASRELRVLKDNYRLMQGLMMSELRHEYQRAIQERQNRIDKLQEGQKFQSENVRNETVAALDHCLENLGKNVDRMLKTQERPNITYKQLPQNQIIDSKQMKGNIVQIENNDNLMSNQLYTEKGKQYINASDRKDILDLKMYIQKLKALQMMKNVISQEQHEREIANLRAQLTSNAALWDQLAEAEKREQITKQELQMTKMSLASYEKLIEKLQGQLENLNNQKARLQQFKNSKSKRIDELENKMKDLEILENIDLNRILTELKNRDKKIDELKLLTQEGKGQVLNAQQLRKEKDITQLKNKLNQERDLKLLAYERLEGLRVEMKALEGKDIKSDLWKDKCRELFEMCKDLEKENSDLKTIINEANKANLLLAQQDANYGISPSINPIEDALSHGQPSLGNRYPAGLGERMFTHRTLGAMAGVKQKKIQPGRLASGGGVFTGYPGIYPGSLPSSSKGVNPSNPMQETVYTDNFNSLKFSGVGQIANQIAEAQDIIQMGGLGIFAEQSMTSGQGGTRDSFPGSGVLAGPMLNFQQHPRGIMTAGGGTRALNAQIKKTQGMNYPDDQRMQSYDPTSSKNINRNSNNNQPWNYLPQSMMNRNQIPKIQQQKGKTLIPQKLIDIQSEQYQNRIQNKGMNLGGMVIQRVNNQGMNQKQQSQDHLGFGAINSSLAQNKGQQPMNVNINFNTTNISLNK